MNEVKEYLNKDRRIEDILRDICNKYSGLQVGEDVFYYDEYMSFYINRIHCVISRNTLSWYGKEALESFAFRCNMINRYIDKIVDFEIQQEDIMSKEDVKLSIKILDAEDIYIYDYYIPNTIKVSIPDYEELENIYNNCMKLNLKDKIEESLNNYLKNKFFIFPQLNYENSKRKDVRYYKISLKFDSIIFDNNGEIILYNGEVIKELYKDEWLERNKERFE